MLFDIKVGWRMPLNNVAALRWKGTGSCNNE